MVKSHFQEVLHLVLEPSQPKTHFDAFTYLSRYDWEIRFSDYGEKYS